MNKNEHAIGVQLLPVNIIYWTQNYSSSLKLNSTRKNTKKDNNIMHVAWRKTLPSKFSVQESYVTPTPMYTLGDDNKIRSKIMLFTLLCKVRWFPGICRCRWHKFHHKSLKFNWDFRILKLTLIRLHRKLIELIHTILKARMLASCGLRW